MSINRETLIGAFNIGGWAPTSRLVSPQVQGDLGTIGERWQGLDFNQRRAAATARVTIWKNGGHALPVLRVAICQATRKAANSSSDTMAARQVSERFIDIVRQSASCPAQYRA